jgi:hypothetical protein
MKLNAINSRVLLRNDCLIALLAVTFICIFLLTTCNESKSDSNGSISAYSDQSVADSNNIAEEGNGPTMIMSYSKRNL